MWADSADAGPLVDAVRALRPQRPIRLVIIEYCNAATDSDLISDKAE
jgi:hypothetical protein